MAWEAPDNIRKLRVMAPATVVKPGDAAAGPLPSGSRRTDAEAGIRLVG